MADYEQKPGTGAIFKNKDKTSDKHPEYKGKFKDLQGNDFDISLWLNESKSGMKYFSCKIQEPYVKTYPTAEEVQPETMSDDNQLPF